MAINDLLTRPVTPAAFLSRRLPTDSSTVVVCAGDSLTHGIMSANWVQVLDQELGPEGFAFVNAGMSGDLAWNLAQRLDQVIACRPDVVPILIGTNDTAARIGPEWRDGYLRNQRLPRFPDLDWYREQLLGIVSRLRAETSARLLLMTIPPLGEDLGSRYNRLVADTNSVIREIGRQHDVEVVPLNDRLTALLSGHSSPPFDGTGRLMGKAVVRRLLLRRSYDSISRRFGRALLIDDVHFNERAARVAADLIKERLTVG